jgi:hypothetical protein
MTDRSGLASMNDLQPLLPPRPADVWKICRDYRWYFGRYPNLLRPRRFTEKMQWRKLFDLNPIYATLLDKLAVREFVASRAGDGWFPPLLWVGDRVEDIPFDTLDPPYIVKCNHGCNFNIVVTDRAFDVDEARTKLKSWLATSYGALIREPAYLPIRPRVFVERLLREADGTVPVEHKCFVFDGRVEFFHSVIIDHSRDKTRFVAFHDREWRNYLWRPNSPTYDRDLPRPERFDDFVSLAERIGAGFDHLRVDMYEWMGQPRVGELTLYNWSGFVRFKPDEADFIIGERWQLRHPVRRALAALSKPR